MSREILLRFGTTNLDKARKAAAAIYKNVKDAANGIKDVDARKRALAAAKSENIENRAALEAERQRQRSDAASLRVRRRNRVFNGPGGVASFGDPAEAAISATEGLGGFRGADLAGRALAQGIEAGAAKFGAAGGIVGVIAAETVAALWEEFARPFLRARFEALERQRLDPILARLRAIEENELGRRFATDINFQGQVLGGAAAANRAQLAAEASKRWTKTSRLRGLP